jgi:hypothetical protein
MKSVSHYMPVHDMPVEACTVPGTRHCPKANGTGLSGVHAPDMAARKSGVASANASAKSSSVTPASVTPASSMATATTSGKEFSWSQDQERACERDCNNTVHGYLHIKEGRFRANWSPKVRRAIG